MESNMESSLQKGIAAAKAGDKKTASQYLKKAVTEEPHNVNAWLWLSSVVEIPKQKMFCYKKVLEVDPDNKHALKGMRIVQETFPPPPSPTKPIPQRVATPKAPQNINGGGCLNGIGKTFLWIAGFFIVAFISGAAATSQNEDLEEIGMTLFFALMAFWALSGYYGAWLLLKKGHGSGLIWITIILGGTPLLIPMFVGPFMFIWGKKARDKHAPAETYIVCPSCSQATSMKSSFCSNCGNRIPQKRV